jgi:RHS repeat-associated protein
VVAETNALGIATIYAYDAVGNLTSRTDGAGVVTLWAYDTMNRVTNMGSGSLVYEYAYDLGGRRTSMVTRVSNVVTEVTTYTYDLADSLLTKTDPTGYVLSYGYDAIGSRTNFSVSSATSAVLNVAYAYDSRNRVKTITGNGRATTFDYDAGSRRTNAVWPNGTTATYTYDEANQLLSLVHAGATSVIASFEYGYDLGGNRTNMTTLEGVNAYGYDNRNWLTHAAYPDGRSQEFEYDGVGNRMQLVEGGTGVPPVVVAYTYGPANRLLSSVSDAETNLYAYDGAGRLTNQLVNGLVRSYGYSFRGQMTTLADTNGSVFSYDFDGDGNRVSQSLNDCLATRFVYDGVNVMLDLNLSNQQVHAYVQGPGIDQPIERIALIGGAPRERMVYHGDALGSVAAMTDDSGTPAKTYAYDAFGAIRAETAGAIMNRYVFTGREALGGAGLYFYRNRVIEPNAGRFTSEDPSGFIDGPDLFLYVGNGPAGRIDPMGLVGAGGGMGGWGRWEFKKGHPAVNQNLNPGFPEEPAPGVEGTRQPSMLQCMSKCLAAKNGPGAEMIEEAALDMLIKQLKRGGKKACECLAAAIGLLADCDDIAGCYGDCSDGVTTDEEERSWGFACRSMLRPGPRHS